MAVPSETPTRTLTFMFTDLEGSTRLWEQYPEAMRAALARHDAILRDAVESSNGQVTKTTGDGLSAVFVSVLDGVRASLKAQRGLMAEQGGETGPLRARIGLHVGEAEPRGGDYYGPAVNRAARLMAVAHGGQVLLSGAAANVVLDMLPEGMGLRDLGQHRLKDLERPEHIFQLLHPDLREDFPPLETLDRRPNNLPAQTTPFIGRAEELREVVSRLRSDSVRLLTLTGPGGMGKTRLALQAAAELIDLFEDGVFFVDLAPVRDPEAVPAAIAQTLDLRDPGDRPLFDELKSQLRDNVMLLLLDNFEQVTPAASLMAELLRDCPGLKLLVTSREVLHVRGENVFPVPALELPSMDDKPPSLDQLTQYEAVRLFIERAQAVKPDFQVTNENAPAVAEICVRLDGLPLAIELAAARIRFFTPQALLERLGNRLNLLRGGARDLPARQQTLRDAIAWSYELLNAGEQQLFELLSVFAGGCTVEAVEAVVGALDDIDPAVDTLEGLASLVEKSLIRQQVQDGGEPRLLMLETIREYAAERLAARADIHAEARLAHATYFADFTRQHWQPLTNHRRQEALATLNADLDNVRAAWSYWVEARDFAQLNKFVDSLWLLYDARGWYHATVALTNDLLNVLSTTPSTPERIEQEIVLQTSLARALLVLKGYTAEVEAAYRRALELSESLGEIPQLFPVLRGLSSLYLYQGGYAQAAEMGRKILSLAESLDDDRMRVEGHLVLGSNLALRENIPAGLEQLEKAIAYFDPARHHGSRFRLGNNPGVACYTVSSLFLWMLGYPERALERALAGVDLAQELAHPYSMAYALFHTSLLHLWRRDDELSLQRAQAALSIADDHGFQVWKAVATCMKGTLLAGMGRADEGLAMLQWGLDVYQGLRTPPVFFPLLLYLQARAFGLTGQPAQGLAIMDRALQIAEPLQGRSLLPAFARLKGELLLAASAENAVDAEGWFRLAHETAQRLQQRSLELLAALSLSQLWRDQGKVDDARRILSEAYAKQTEGFALPHWQKAREMLRSMDESPAQR